MSNALTAGQVELAKERPDGRSPWPQLDVRGWQNAVLLVLLVLLELIATVLTPSTVTESYWDYVSMASMGASLAVPALLALWAVFGPEAIGFRLPATAWLAAANYVGLMYGAWRNDELQDSQIVYFGAWMLAFTVLQLPLWLLRAVRHWRLTLTPEASAQSAWASHSGPARADGHFTLRSLFFWTLATAVLLAIVRKLTPDAGPELADALAALPDAGLASLFVALGGLPVIPLAWILLARGRRPVLRAVLATLLVAGVGGGIPLFLYLDENRSGWQLTAVVAGTIVNGLLSQAVIGTCGYRLDRRPRASALPARPTQLWLFANESGTWNGLIERTPLSARRFALGLMPLLALAAALAGAVPRRLEEWRRADVMAEWERRGFQVGFEDDGQIGYLSYADDRPTSDETWTTISRLPVLETLYIPGSRIDDRRLSLLTPLRSVRSLIVCHGQITDAGLNELRRFDQLEFLDLTNTRITDAGLANLAALPNLRCLRLQMTEITDDGLMTLAKLPRLSQLEVSLTAVSEAGASQFRRACPNVELEYGACDQWLAGLLVDPSSRVALAGAAGAAAVSEIHVVPLQRLHLRGTKTVAGTVFRVTDAALVWLSKEPQLEELDLRETAVTDKGLLALAKLASLKRLDLRGTAVSEQAAAQLAESLPNCQIVGGASSP